MSDNGDRPFSGLDLTDHEFNFDEFGFLCPHAWQAAGIGIDRLERVAARDDPEALFAEWTATDPYARIYLLVGAQRALFRLQQQLETALRILQLGSGLDLVGQANNLLHACWTRLDQLFEEVGPAFVERANSLHTKDHELKPWPYPDEQAATASAKPAAHKEVLTEEDDRRALGLLNSLFSGMTRDPATGEERDSA